MQVIDFAIVSRSARRILVQQRSSDRRLFPDCWELPGGHREAGESVEECLRRELAEETSMTLTGILGEAYRFRWPSDPRVENLIYAIQAAGCFRPEPGKVVAYRWIDQEGIVLLLRPDETSNGLHMGARRVFDLIGQMRISGGHAA